MRASCVARFLVAPLLALVACTPRHGTEVAEPAPFACAREPKSVLRAEDATPAFWRFWDAAKTRPVEEQVDLFERTVIATRPALFDPRVVGRDPTRTTSDLHERLPAWLTALPRYEPAMRRLSASIDSDLRRHAETFRAAFPCMRWKGRVIFSVSVDAFDGAVRVVDGEPSLVFGIDKIARLQGEDADLAPLFHHELFHVYQDDVNPFPELPEDAPHGLARPLWAEGLAVYVSKALNPRASWKQLLLGDELVTETKQALPRIASELRASLDDASPETYRDFFLGAGKRDDIPRRSAYVVGLLAVERIAAGRTLDALARMPEPEMRHLLGDVLESFARGA